MFPFYLEIFSKKAIFVEFVSKYFMESEKICYLIFLVNNLFVTFRIVDDIIFSKNRKICLIFENNENIFIQSY